MLIRQYTNEEHGKSLAPHLRGGQFQINRFGKGHRPVLRYISEWDSASKAADFFAVYRKILLGKSQHCDFTLINPEFSRAPPTAGCSSRASQEILSRV